MKTLGPSVTSNLCTLIIAGGSQFYRYFDKLNIPYDTHGFPPFEVTQNHLFSPKRLDLSIASIIGQLG